MANEVDNLRIRINANAGKAAKNIEKLAAALEKLKGSTAVSSLNQLSSSLSKVATSSNTLNKNINSLTKIGNSYNKTVSTMQSKTTSWGGSVFRSAMNIRASFLLIRGSVMLVARTLGDCFNESSAYIENLNLFAVSMGDNYEKAKEYAERVQGALGIDASAWMAYQGKFQNLTTGFGVASDKAAVMSQTLTQLTYDLSSFFNVDFDTAFKKLQSGMTGQIKGLKEYGINLSVAALQEYADAHAINVKVRQLTEAERAILRYNLVMERTAKMQGDMARTIITPANSMRIFSNQVTLAKRAIGNLISVVLVKFIPYMQAFVRVIEWVASELAKLFGFELPKIDYSGMNELVTATGGVNEAVSDIGDAINDVGDNSDTTTKKVKELKKNLLQLMGFDEINILKSPVEDISVPNSEKKQKTTGTGVDIGNVGLGDFADNIPTYDFLKNLDTKKADELFEKFKKIGQKVIDIVKWTIKWWDVIKLIGKILLTIWAIGKIVKFIAFIIKIRNAIKEILTFLKGFSIVKFFNDFGFIKKFKAGETGIQKFIDNFRFGWDYEKKYGRVGSKFVAGLREARSEMSIFSKILITVGTSLASFFAFKDFGYSMAKGTLTWHKALLDVLIAAGAIGVAFALTGPVGGAITVIAAIGGAVYGAVKHMKELEEEGIKAAHQTAEWKETAAVIEELKEIENEATQSMKDMALSVDNYNQLLTYSLPLANTLLEEIQALNSKQRLSVREMVQMKSKVELLNSLKIDGISLTFDEATGHIKESNKQLSEMRKNLLENAKTAALTDILTTSYKALYTNIGKINMAQSDLNRAKEKQLEYDKLANYYGQIGDTKNHSKYLELYKQATKEIEQTYKTYDKIKVAIGQASDNIGNYGKELEKLAGGAKTSGENVNKGFIQGLGLNQDKVTDILETNAGKDMTAFNNALGIESPSKEFAKSGVNIDEGIIKGINSKKSKVTSTISRVGKQAVSTFNKSITGFKTGGFVKAFNDIAKKASSTFKTSTWSGYASNANTALNAFNITSLVKKLSNVYDKAKSVFSKANWNTFKTSVNKVNTAVFDSLHLKMNNIRTKAQSVFSQTTWEGYAKQVSKGFDRGLNLPKFELQIGQDTNVKLTKAQKAILKAAGINKDYMPLISWKEYARGGKPINGEYFIARENGAELVGRVGSSNAVMNNDQIVAAVSQGVYNAVVGAISGMQSGDGGTYNINVYAQIDGRTVGEASVEYHNGQVLQKGASPLIGVAKA